MEDYECSFAVMPAKRPNEVVKRTDQEIGNAVVGVFREQTKGGNSMTFWGKLRNGHEMLLGDPIEAELTYNGGVSWDQLKAVFPVSQMWEPLVEVSAYHSGLKIFQGAVVKQTCRLGGTVMTVKLVCRSRN